MIQFFLMKIPCFPRFLLEYRSCFGITAYQVCFSMLTYHVRYKFQSRWPGRWIMRRGKKPLFSGDWEYFPQRPVLRREMRFRHSGIQQTGLCGRTIRLCFYVSGRDRDYFCRNHVSEFCGYGTAVFFSKAVPFFWFFFGKARKPDVKTPVSGSVREVYGDCIKE